LRARNLFVDGVCPIGKNRGMANSRLDFLESLIGYCVVARQRSDLDAAREAIEQEERLRARLAELERRELVESLPAAERVEI
jgi:hypothetical protein